MDLSSLAAPAFGADGGFASDAEESFRSATSAVLQFARAASAFGAGFRSQPGAAKAAARSTDPPELAQASAFAKSFGSAFSAISGIDIAGPISMGLNAVGLISSLFGGKKLSVGPGGGLDFTLDATGKASSAGASQDNGYDAYSANIATADAIGKAAVDFIAKLGGTYAGVVDAAFPAGHVGYDAGAKKYTGGRAYGFTQQYDDADKAAEAALVDVIKFAKIDGLSKDIRDRIAAVETAGDMAALATYVDQLHQIKDAFTGWAAPMTAGEAALETLTDAFAAARSAAESLGESVSAVQESFDRQKEYLVQQFTAQLQTRYLRATGDSQAADLRSFDAQAAITRRDAAALGSEAVLQAERTLGAERAAIVRRYEKQAIDAAVAGAVAAQSSAQAVYAGLVEELKRAQEIQRETLTRSRDLWEDMAKGVQRARDGLAVGRLSPLDPRAQMEEAQRQLATALGRARAGDAAAAGQIQGLAEQALSQTQGYFASGPAYDAYFRSVQDQLAGLQAFAVGQTSAADQQLSALRATEANTRSVADITRDILTALTALAAAQRNVVGQAAGGGPAGAASSAAIYAAYQRHLGRDPDPGGAAYWAEALRSGSVTPAQMDDLFRTSAEAQTRSTPRFATGGSFGGGLRIVGEQGPELEATGPSRIWTFDQTQRLLTDDNSPLAAAIAALGAKLDALIRVSAGAGDENAQRLSALHDELAELRRKARLTEVA